MMLKRLLKEEKGAAVIVLTIILSVFALGFIALVVDAGILYEKRKMMITSADAAALAGAQILRDSDGEDITEAEDAARDFAIANGADPDNVEVLVGDKEVTLQDDETEVRQIVEVTVLNTEPLIFARFMGDDNSDVAAHSIATWGYVYKSYIGDFIPLFSFNTEYQLDTDIKLHGRVEDTNFYGFIDIGNGMGDIKAGISGTTVTGGYIYENMLDGKPGEGDSVRLAIEDRMKKAQGKATAEERRNAMIGLIPIIDRDEFFDIEENNGGNANKYKLPIDYFGYFEIIDVIKKNGDKGSPEALDPSNEYNKVTTQFDYTTLLGGEKAGDTYILGRFIGDKVEARTIAEIGDQINPNPDGDPPARYYKLIK